MIVITNYTLMDCEGTDFICPTTGNEALKHLLDNRYHDLDLLTDISVADSAYEYSQYLFKDLWDELENYVVFGVL